MKATQAHKSPRTSLKNPWGWAIGFGVMILMLPGVASAGGGAGDGSKGVPEIDAGSALSALAVLGGGLLLVTDRLRRRKGPG